MTWIEEQVNAYVETLRKEQEYLFGLTHYDWMYRATGDTKYLEEQKEYIKKHRNGTTEEA